MPKITRRKCLLTAAVGTVGSLAGCLGIGGDNTLDVGESTETDSELIVELADVWIVHQLPGWNVSVDDGNTLYLFELSIRNNGTNELSIPGIDDMIVEDGEELRYGPADAQIGEVSTPTEATGFESRTLATGETEQGLIAFELPNDISEAILRVGNVPDGGDAGVSGSPDGNPFQEDEDGEDQAQWTELRFAVPDSDDGDYVVDIGASVELPDEDAVRLHEEVSVGVEVTNNANRSVRYATTLEVHGATTPDGEARVELSGTISGGETTTDTVDVTPTDTSAPFIVEFDGETVLETGVQPINASLGETVTLPDDLAVTVGDVRFTDEIIIEDTGFFSSGAESITPDGDQQFVLLWVESEHTGNVNDIAAVERGQVSVEVDRQKRSTALGSETLLEPVSESTLSSPRGFNSSLSVSPGGVERGWVVFEVPSAFTESDLRIHVERSRDGEIDGIVYQG